MPCLMSVHVHRDGAVVDGIEHQLLHWEIRPASNVSTYNGWTARDGTS